VPNEPTATNTAPAAAPASAPAAPRKQVHSFNAKKAFEGTSAVDRMKQYLKDVPVLHARLTTTIASLEATLAAAKKSAAELEKVTADIKVTVAKLEEEQSHARPGHHGPAATPPGSASVDANAGLVLPGAVANPTAGPAAADPAAGVPPSGT